MEPAAIRLRVYRWYVLGVLTLCYTLSFVDTKLPFILIEPIKRDLHLSDTQLGLITGPAFSLVYACAAIPIARISDRGGRNLILGSAVLVWSLFTFAGGLVRTPLQLLLSRTGVAVGEAACTPAAHSLIADYFEPRLRGRALAIYMTGSTLGTTIAMAGGGLLAQYASWRIAMFVVGATGLVLTLAMFLTVRERQSATVDPPAAGAPMTIWRMLKIPEIRNVLFGGTFTCITLGSVTAWTPAFASRYFGMSVGSIGVSLGLVAGALGLAGTLTGGLANDTLSRRRPGAGLSFLAAAIALSALLRGVSFFMPGYGSFLAVGSVATLLLMFYTGPSYATVQAAVPRVARSRGSALLMFGFNGIGIASGAYFTGLLSDLLAPRFGPDSLRAAMFLVTSSSLLAVGGYAIAARAVSRASTAAVGREIGPTSAIDSSGLTEPV